MGEVESLEAHYFELKSKLSTGAIDPEEFRSQVARLWFEDEAGHTWMVGAQTGHWYVYKNDQWTLAEPPRAQTSVETISCPRCNEKVDVHAAFCGHCGYRLQEPVSESVHISDLDSLSHKIAADETATPIVGTLTPPAARRLSRRALVAAGGAALFATLFVCFGVVGALILLRNGPLVSVGGVSAVATTPVNRSTLAANSRMTSTPTPTQTPTRAQTSAPAPTNAATVPATAIVSTIPARAGTAVPTPLVFYIETPTPTGTPTPVVIAPTGTPTPVPSPTPPPTPTPTTTTAPPTNTPAPPTNTPIPRPPTNTPTPAIALKGRIAFTILNQRPGGRKAYDVYVNTVDGANRQLVSPKRRQPQFSPDGNLLVTMGMDDEREKLWIRDLSTGAERDIANTPIESMQPSWSPDGATVLYASTEFDDRQSRLYVVNAQGAPESRPWLKTGATDLVGRYPTWLPNGQIVYSGCDKWANTGQCGVVRVNPDGGSPTMLTVNERDGVDTAPSGRGNTVVFMSIRDGNWEIYSVPLSGGQARNLTNNPAADGLPVISPDGQFIAFASNRSGQWAIWAMRTDGSDQRLLFNTEGEFATDANTDWTTERISWGP